MEVEEEEVEEEQFQPEEKKMPVLTQESLQDDLIKNFVSEWAKLLHKREMLN